jgi:hypothetical protein
MTTLSLEEKQQYIWDSEQELARQLALQVLDKPTPPIWMIFIPIFFVFYAWKLKQYTSGLKSFADHYLVSRRRALEASIEAQQRNKTVDIEALLGKADSLPDQVKPLYRQWMILLTGHYAALLTARGSNHAALVRSGYHSKSNYLLFCNRLSQAEHAFNLALLPQIEGQSEDLRAITEKMEAESRALRRQESDLIFA